MTDRGAQEAAKKKGLPWAAAKGHDTFMPLSTFIPKATIVDLNNVELWLKVHTIDWPYHAMYLWVGVIGEWCREATRQYSWYGVQCANINCICIIHRHVRTWRSDLNWYPSLIYNLHFAIAAPLMFHLWMVNNRYTWRCRTSGSWWYHSMWYHRCNDMFMACCSSRCSCQRGCLQQIINYHPPCCMLPLGFPHQLSPYFASTSSIINHHRITIKLSA